MMSFEKARELLGLTSDFSDAELRQAYRDLSKVWHPDRFMNDPRLRQVAEEKQREVNRAYQYLLSAEVKTRRKEPSREDQADRAQPPPQPQTTESSKPDPCRQMFESGKELQNAGKTRAAAGVYKKMLRQCPDHGPAHLAYGRLMYVIDKVRDALVHYRQACRLMPNNLNANYGRGLAAMGSGKIEEAIQAFEVARMLNPEEPAIWVQLAIAYNAAKRYDESIAAFKKALLLDPEVVAAGSNMEALFHASLERRTPFLLSVVGRQVGVFATKMTAQSKFLAD